ncbi:MAG TPA: carboxypeptidase-like regulatory domain-containing protein, partial [Chitinophagaceae bacterium]|nr:carboxypeptidase-like regulatory domain-containing protein [Chitinophagaceae bacterium]
MKKVLKEIFLLCLFAILGLSSWAQEKTVAGKVTGPNGAPVSKASIQVKGTTIGTSTHESGAFSFAVPSS